MRNMGLLFLLSLLLSTPCRLHNAQDVPRNRSGQGRVFSLFSIVQFPNEACDTTSNVYSNGWVSPYDCMKVKHYYKSCRTCFTTSECSAKGGLAQGNCAAGFGVCCVCKSVPGLSFTKSSNFFYVVVSVSSSGSRISQNCSYIVNPGYPRYKAMNMLQIIIMFNLATMSLPHSQPH